MAALPKDSSLDALASYSEQRMWDNITQAREAGTPIDHDSASRAAPLLHPPTTGQGVAALMCRTECGHTIVVWLDPIGNDANGFTSKADARAVVTSRLGNVIQNGGRSFTVATLEVWW